MSIAARLLELGREVSRRNSGARGGPGPLALVAGLGAVVLVLFWRVLLGEVPLPTGHIFGDPPWSGHTPAGASIGRNDLLGDVTFQMYPWHVYAWQRLRSLEVPLWNPHSLAGMPFLANGQAAPFAPLSLLSLLFPVDRGVTVMVLLKLLLAGTGMALFLRRLACTAKGVWCGAVAFMLCGSMVVWLGWPHAQVMMLLPWMIWTTDGAVVERTRGWLLALAVVVAAGLLGGHAESSAHELYASGLYALLRAWTLRPLGRRAVLAGLGCFSAAVSIGVAVAAVQLLPLLEYLSRSAALDERAKAGAAGPLPFWTALTWVAPFFVGHPARGTYRYELGMNFNEQCGYAGGVALLFSAAAFSTARRRAQAVALAILLLVALIVIYGGPGRGLLLLLPGLRLAANQRLVFVAAFALAGLAGLGVSAVEESAAAPPLAALGATVAGVALVLVAVAFEQRLGIWAPGESGSASKLWHPRYLFALWVPLGALFVLAAAVALLGRTGSGRARIATAAAVLAPLELLFFAWHYNPTLERRAIYPETPEAAFLQRSGERWAALDLTLQPNASVVYGLDDLRAYDALFDRRWRAYFERVSPGRDLHLLTPPGANPIALEVAGVRYLLAPAGVAMDRPSLGLRETAADLPHRIWQDQDTAIWERPWRRPRAWLADAIRVGTSADAAAAIGDASMHGHLAAIVEEPVDADAGAEAAAPLYRRRSPEQIAVETDTTRRRLLVINESSDPGWSATIDGAPAHLVHANLVFQAVVVPAGHHLTELRYRPVSFSAGVGLTLLGLAGWGAIFATMRRKRPPGGVPGNLAARGSQRSLTPGAARH